MPAGTELVAGEWWPEDYSGPPLVSVEDEVAEAYGVGIGDRLGFNILGRVIEAEIANLRAEIDWGEARLDFVFLFSPGVLEAAPHTLAAAVDVPPAAEAALLDRMAEVLPNVTPISVRELVARVDEVMGKIKLAVAAVASVTLLERHPGAGRRGRGGAPAASVRIGRAQGAGRPPARRLPDLPDRVSRARHHRGAGRRHPRQRRRGRGGGLCDGPAVGLLARRGPAVLLIALAITLAAGFLGTWRLLGRPAAPVLRSP